MRMPCLAGAALLALAGCSTTPDVAHKVSTVSTGEAREAARLISSYRTARGLDCSVQKLVRVRVGHQLDATGRQVPRSRVRKRHA